MEVKQAVMLTFQGRRIVKGKVKGEALVSKERISFFGGVDPETGDVTEKGHELEGCNVTNRVLIYPTGKGSTGGSYKIYDMAYRKTAPAAIVNREAESITAIGAILGNIPMVDSVKDEIFDSVKTGDWVDIDADAGIIRVKQNQKERTSP